MRLVVVSDAVFASYELPVEGKVTLGRSDKSDVRIDDPSITRRHAVLRIDARGHVDVEDLGSANGTVVGEERLRPGQRVRVLPGRSFHLGSALVMLQAALEVAATSSASDDVATRRGHVDGARARQRAPDDGAPIVSDPKMVALYAYVDRIALGNIAVLVTGETGVGKELVAERLHRSSGRRRGPFLRLNCAAVAESLLESELFGYERGAFTGATQPKPGLLESVDGGTVLLDEIGEMPLPVQAKILRVLESKQVTRVGGLTPRSVDVRFVAATHRDLPELVRLGRFREDLYFRLNAATVEVPPLRERVGEIRALAVELVARASRDLGHSSPPRIADGTLSLFERYRWPGNVRELRNFIERAVLLASGPELLPEHFPIARMASTLTSQPLGPRAPDAPFVPREAEPADLERERILSTLAACGGNQSRAAKALGIARSTLVLRLDSYGVTRPRKA